MMMEELEMKNDGWACSALCGRIATQSEEEEAG
jgi:hypothetical protein